MKKRFSVFYICIAFLLMIGCFSTIKIKSKVFADEINNESFPVEIKSKSSMLIDANSKTVIFSKNENEHLPIASMCKIMTLLLCFDGVDNGEISLDEKITVSENASGMGGSQVFLERGGEYPVGDLIKSITVASANDACVAMAERLCGSESAFVDKMNEKARNLGMNDTVFVNCTGLPKSGQYSCAKDVATMFSSLISHKEYFNFSKIWMDKIDHPKGRITEISNTNKLIKFYDGCDCGKTGYTSEAGHCLCASAIKNDMRLISVVISSPDSKTRFREISSMFDYGFNNFVNKLIISSDENLDYFVPVKGGKKDNVIIKADEPFYDFSKKGIKNAYEFDYQIYSDIKAPVLSGDKIGELKIYKDNFLVKTISLSATENVDKKGFWDVIDNIRDNWQIVG